MTRTLNRLHRTERGHAHLDGVAGLRLLEPLEQVARGEGESVAIDLAG
jgi:hypothetical protein